MKHGTIKIEHPLVCGTIEEAMLYLAMHGVSYYCPSEASQQAQMKSLILETLGEMQMIKPTVGRVVWVYRPADTIHADQPEVGLITYVFNDRYVNVAGFNANGMPFTLTSLYLVQEGEAKPEGCFAGWMPYQIATAKRDPEKIPPELTHR